MLGGDEDPVHPGLTAVHATRKGAGISAGEVRVPERENREQVRLVNV